MSIIDITDLDLAGKRVLIRQDLNVSIVDGVVTSDARIKASLPTLEYALNAGAKVIVMSHLGRPDEGSYDQRYSLQPVADHLIKLTERPVRFVRDYLYAPLDVQAGELVVLENVRFNLGEKFNDDILSKQYAALCDVFVMDAFGAAHRAQSSTCGVGFQSPIACSGLLLKQELVALQQALESPAQPLVAIVGGAKVSTKLMVLNTLSELVDQLIVGGGIANTFIAAEGHKVGRSLCEHDLINDAQQIIQDIKRKGGQLPIPSDVITGKAFSANTPSEHKKIDAVDNDDMIFDIGNETAHRYASMLKEAATIVWNGPVGVFEFDQFGEGTRIIAEAIAQSNAFSIAGGGDTLAAVEKYGIAEDISYISTGGGAFLEFLEGKKLPAVAMLEECAR